MYTVSRGLVLDGSTHTCSTDVYLPLHQRLSFCCIIAPPPRLGSRPISRDINHRQRPGSIGGEERRARRSFRLSVRTKCLALGSSAES